jgi:hypothetical protein
MHPVNFLSPQLGFNFKTVMTKCSWMHLNRLEIWRLYAGWTFARTFYFPWTKTNADTPSGCNVGLSTVKTLTWSPLHRNKESKKNKNKKSVWKCLACHQEYIYKESHSKNVRNITKCAQAAFCKIWEILQRYIHMRTKRNLFCLFFLSLCVEGHAFWLFVSAFSLSLFQLDFTVKERAFDLVFIIFFLSSTCDTGMSVLTVSSLSLYIYVRDENSRNPKSDSI